MHGQHDLLEIVGALGTAGSLSGRLHGWQQQRNQHGDDGDDDQEFDQSETATQTRHVNDSESMEERVTPTDHEAIFSSSGSSREDD